MSEKIIKKKRQRAIITLTDSDDGHYRCEVVYEPSIKKRKTESPAVNAALRLGFIIRDHHRALSAPIFEKQPQIIITDHEKEENKKEKED